MGGPDESPEYINKLDMKGAAHIERKDAFSRIIAGLLVGMGTDSADAP